MTPGVGFARELQSLVATDARGGLGVRPLALRLADRGGPQSVQALAYLGWTGFRTYAAPQRFAAGAVGSFGVAVVVETERPFTFQRHIAHLRLRADRALPEFVAEFINSPAGRQQSESAALGGAQRTVTLASLAAFEIPLPSLVEQRRIAAELREGLAAIDRMTAAIEAELEAIDALPAALLREAFADVGSEPPPP